MKFLELEERIKNWIGNHMVLFCLILFGVGLGLGLLGNILLGGDTQQGFRMGFVYAFLLMVVEASAGGSGTK